MINLFNLKKNIKWYEHFSNISKIQIEYWFQTTL